MDIGSISERITKFMQVIQRIHDIILTPKSEWGVIADESTSIRDLYKGYIIPMAAISPVSYFIGASFVGIRGAYRTPVMFGLSQAVIYYVLTLIGVFAISIVISVLAPIFGGKRNQLQALKVAAYAYTPVWLAGMLYTVPVLGIAVLLVSLYGVYVLYFGLFLVMKSSEEQFPAAAYTTVIAICAIAFGFMADSTSSRYRFTFQDTRQVEQTPPSEIRREIPREKPREKAREIVPAITPETRRPVPREAPREIVPAITPEITRETRGAVRATPIVPAITPEMRREARGAVREAPPDVVPAIAPEMRREARGVMQEKPRKATRVIVPSIHPDDVP
jgi:hypothetical protein